MKKFLQFLAFGILYGCTCLGQLPTQYVYVDENCNAVLPDYSQLVMVQDNCNNPSLYQAPEPGTIITETTNVEMKAVDVYGNHSEMYFDVVLLDTIPPTMMLNPDWAYTDKEVSDMYRTFYGHTQLRFIKYNEEYAGDTIEYEIDTMKVVWVVDTVKVFQNTIPIPDNISDVSWWWAESSN